MRNEEMEARRRFDKERQKVAGGKCLHESLARGIGMSCTSTTYTDCFTNVYESFIYLEDNGHTEREVRNSRDGHADMEFPCVQVRPITTTKLRDFTWSKHHERNSEDMAILYVEEWNNCFELPSNCVDSEYNQAVSAYV